METDFYRPSENLLRVDKFGAVKKLNEFDVSKQKSFARKMKFHDNVQERAGEL